MHIERERENMKLRHATPGQQTNTGHHSSTTFKSVSLQPPSQPNHPARHPTLPSQPASSNPTPKRDLKLTVSIIFCEGTSHIQNKVVFESVILWTKLYTVIYSTIKLKIF